MKLNKEKITKELCWKNNIIFFPKTKEEATLIQEKLFALGYHWADGSQEVRSINDALSFGIVLQNSKIYTRGEKDNTDYVVCRLSQFDKGDMPELTPQEQNSLQNEFNQLALLVRDMAKKVDAMYAQIMPQKLDKPALKNQKPGE